MNRCPNCGKSDEPETLKARAAETYRLCPKCASPQRPEPPVEEPRQVRMKCMACEAVHEYSDPDRCTNCGRFDALVPVEEPKQIRMFCVDCDSVDEYPEDYVGRCTNCEQSSCLTLAKKEPTNCTAPDEEPEPKDSLKNEKFSTRTLFERTASLREDVQRLSHHADVTRNLHEKSQEWQTRHADSITDICKRLDELEHCAQTGEPYPTGMAQVEEGPPVTPIHDAIVKASEKVGGPKQELEMSVSSWNELVREINSKWDFHFDLVPADLSHSLMCLMTPFATIDISVCIDGDLDGWKLSPKEETPDAT